MKRTVRSLRAVGSRVMFTGPYGVGENGACQAWLLVTVLAPGIGGLVGNVTDQLAQARIGRLTKSCWRGNRL